MATLTELKQLQEYVDAVDAFFGDNTKTPPEELDFTAEDLGNLLNDDYEKQLKTTEARLRPTVQAAKIGYALLKNKKNSPEIYG